MSIYRKNYSTLMIIVLGFCFLINATNATDVKQFGAKGDGVTDDTKAINRALTNTHDGILEFTKGIYRINQTIEIDLARYGTISVTGSLGNAAIVMYGEGPALRFTGTHDKGSALPSSVPEQVWLKERFPIVDAIEIRGENPLADGLEFRNTLQPTVKSVLIRNVRHGIHLTSRNRNVLIEGSHIYHCSGLGIFLDAVNIHQMIIGNSHISYCRGGGVKVAESEIRNFQMTGNDIEYNCDPVVPDLADIWIDISKRGSVREGTISSSTIQAIQSPNGANIRFTGQPGHPEKIGLWSITGNHISNQDINIELTNVQGISVTGNTFIRGYKRNLITKSSKGLIFSANVFDRNPDYFTKNIVAPGGVLISECEQIIFAQNILEGVEYGSAEKGAALMINASQNIDIHGTQIINSAFRGIEIENCENIQVSACRITETGKNKMIESISSNGTAGSVLFTGNILSRGTGGKGISGVSKSTLKKNTLID